MQVRGCGARKPTRLPARARGIQAPYFHPSRAPSAGTRVRPGQDAEDASSLQQRPLSSQTHTATSPSRAR